MFQYRCFHEVRNFCMRCNLWLYFNKLSNLLHMEQLHPKYWCIRRELNYGIGCPKRLIQNHMLNNCQCRYNLSSRSTNLHMVRMYYWHLYSKDLGNLLHMCFGINKENWKNMKYNYLSILHKYHILHHSLHTGRLQWSICQGIHLNKYYCGEQLNYCNLYNHQLSLNRSHKWMNNYHIILLCCLG